MKRFLTSALSLVCWSSLSAAPVAQSPACSAPSFKAAVSYQVGGHCCSGDLQGVVVADLNNDGSDDVVTANGSSNTVSVLLGDGLGFAPAVNFPVGGTRPYSLAVGDFNEDGKADVVTANLISENLSVLLGDGAGGLAPATRLRAGTDPVYVITADFNGDDNLDLAVASTDGDAVNVLLGNGAGGFGSFSGYGTGDTPRALAAADFNLDGKLDLAVANRGSNNVSVLNGDGAGGFAAAALFDAGSMPEHLATGDFNGDGKVDLAVGNYGAFNVAVFAGVGDGRFGPSTNLNVGSPVSFVTVGDFNQDGNADVASGSYGAGVSVRLGDGTGRFGAARTARVASGPLYLALTDFNRDGSEDLLVGTYQANTLILLAGDGTGNFNTTPTYSTGTNVISTVLADFNGDGKPDAALANENTNTVSIRLGSGTGAFGNATNFAVGTRPYSLSVGDFNLDGKLDLVTANFTNGNLSVLLGDGAGGFGAASAVGLGSPPYYPRFVAASDVNNDGKADLLLIRDGLSAVTVLLGNGAGGFENPVKFATAANPKALAVGDFNGDGKVDLAVTDNSVSVLPGDGAGGFGPPINTHFGQNTGSRAIVARDFNGDGKLDVVVANEHTGDVSLLAGDGTGKFAPRVNYKVGSQPSALEVGDFNGDGKTDLVVGNLVSQNVGVLAGDGAGGFASATSWSVPVNPLAVSVGDLDGDGRTDITAAGSGVLAVLLNTCGGIAPPPEARLSVNDVTIMEGDSGTVDAVFNVSLSAASARTVTAKFFTGAGSSRRGEDFQPVASTVTFAPGVTSQTISVSVVGDTVDEFNESFTVNLYEPVDALIADRRGQGTITDDDLEPSVSVGNISAPEGQVNNTFGLSVTLTRASGKLMTVTYITADGSAAAGVDYVGNAGILAIPAGASSGVINVQVVGDSVNEPDETFFVNLTNPINASIAVARGVATIVNDDSPAVQFGNAGLTFAEGVGRATVTVARTGDVSGATTLDFRTSDSDTFTVGCADAAGNLGGAYARCDFATTVGTLLFAPGETSKQIVVPIIDDGHVEGPETFQLFLSNVTGATLSKPDVATVTIQDNDAAGAQNPVMTHPFFVRQQYLDFLSREPDTDGFNAWLSLLNGCTNAFNGPTTPSNCDRIFVSGEGFFRSVEFQLKGFYVFRFYKAGFDRLPDYLEVVSDMSFVAGQTAEEVYARKAQLATLFTQRQEFQNLYGRMTNAQYINALLARYQLTQVTTPDPAQPDGSAKVTLTAAELTNQLNANTLSRAQVLRAVADSDAVGMAEFNNAFVAMQYYGYLRRKPDQGGFNAWLDVLRSGDVRTMVNGFLNSTEYKLRFGQP